MDRTAPGQSSFSAATRAWSSARSAAASESAEGTGITLASEVIGCAKSEGAGGPPVERFSPYGRRTNGEFRNGVTPCER
jgi:hypothetical protein